MTVNSAEASTTHAQNADNSLHDVSNPGGMASASIDEGKPEGDAAMNMMSTIDMGATAAHTFNPAFFLAEFIDVGGGYCLTPDGQLCLGVLHEGASARDEAKVFEAIQRLTPADKDGIKAHLAGGGGAASRAVMWGVAMARYETAQRNRADMLEREKAGEAIDRDEDDRICNELYDARDTVLALPAPGRAELVWKLETAISDISDQSGVSWIVPTLAPTVAEVRAYLVGHCSDDIKKAWSLALKAERDACTAAEVYYRDVATPVFSANDAGLASIEEVHAQEQAYNELLSAHHRAVTALVMTPAPDWQAVLLKLSAEGNAEWYFDGSDECQQALQAVSADIRRLSGEV